MQVSPITDYERKNIQDWDYFDYLNCFRNAADRCEFNGDEKGKEIISKIADSLQNRIKRDLGICGL